jgi:hypothetical protein
MKKLVILLTLLGLTHVAQAQILLSNFSNLSSQAYSPLNLSWGFSEGQDQYIQNSGNVTITKVSGSGPNGQGSFDAVFPGDNTANPADSVNFTGVVLMSLTAELGATNTDSEIVVSVYDSTDINEIGSAEFLTAGFTTTGFTTETVAFIPTLNGGNVTGAQYFNLTGDGSSTSVVSFSLDNLQTGLYVTPEPSTWAMMGLGLCGLIGFCLRRKRSLSA